MELPSSDTIYLTLFIPSIGTVQSGVYIVSPDKKISVFTGTSNLDGKIKRDAKNKINAFIQNDKILSLSSKFVVQNVFFWVGLPFLAIGLLGFVGWPQTIWQTWKKQKNH